MKRENPHPLILSLSNDQAGKHPATFFHQLPVLVTGGAGFIGSHLSEKLVALGARVTVIDNLSTGNRDNLATILDKIEFIEDTITNRELCIQAAQDKKVIFHLAATTSVPESFEKPDLYHAVNILGTAHILESARLNNVPTVIFSSSSAVYGAATQLCSEETVCLPISPYGYSKLIGELLCRQYAELFKINTIMLRYLNVYGERQNPHGPYASAVAKFRNAFKNNQPITVFGDGSQTRDFVPVAEIVEANIVTGMRAPHLSGYIFNIGTGKSISIVELLTRLKKEFVDYAQPITFEAARAGDIQHSRVSCAKYHQLRYEQENI